MIVRQKEDKEGVEFVGTGFLIHQKGYYLTCSHTINLTDKLGVIPPLPVNEFNPITLERVNILSVSIAQVDTNHDVAVLKIDTPQPLSVPNNLIGDPETVLVGSSVGYLGYPFGHSGLHALKVSSSIISSKVLSQTGTQQFQIDAMVHEGNSGGPLIELSSNRIIGIINGRFSPTGNAGGIRIGNHPLGTESTISYATSISYGIEVMQSEGLNV